MQLAMQQLHLQRSTPLLPDLHSLQLFLLLLPLLLLLLLLPLVAAAAVRLRHPKAQCSMTDQARCGAAWHAAPGLCGICAVAVCVLPLHHGLPDCALVSLHHLQVRRRKLPAVSHQSGGRASEAPEREHTWQFASNSLKCHQLTTKGASRCICGYSSCFTAWACQATASSYHGRSTCSSGRCGCSLCSSGHGAFRHWCSSSSSSGSRCCR